MDLYLERFQQVSTIKAILDYWQVFLAGYWIQDKDFKGQLRKTPLTQRAEQFAQKRGPSAGGPKG